MQQRRNPKVSICLPSLNTFPYLPERFATIFTQTFSDWELLVYDSYSDDPSWQYIQEKAATDSRIHAWQGPRQGAYAAWNTCIKQARGEYVYIATSDDTMASNCIQQLVEALEHNRDCDLAHCPLVIIDKDGKAPPDRLAWPHGTAYYGPHLDWMRESHIQRAPYVGLLHLSQAHAYLSITQILIRRSLFKRVGYFQSQWGTVSDFNWEMRAGMVANLVHTPNTWASWRIHPQQLSASIDILSSIHDAVFEAMIEDAIASTQDHLHPTILKGLKSEILPHTASLRSYYAGLRQRESWVARRVFQIDQLISGSSIARSEILNRLMRRQRGTWNAARTRAWLEALGIGEFICRAQPTIAERCIAP